MSHPHIPGLDSPRQDPPSNPEREAAICVATCGLVSAPVLLVGKAILTHPEWGACVGWSPVQTVEVAHWIGAFGAGALAYAFVGMVVLCWRSE